jgi:hypothetical protein
MCKGSLFFSALHCEYCKDQRHLSLPITRCRCFWGVKADEEDETEREPVVEAVEENENERMPVCPDCKKAMPAVAEDANRYWCGDCKKQQKTTVCKKCHKDWKECKERQKEKHICPHCNEHCMPHRIQIDSQGRVKCPACKTQQQFGSLVCARCFQSGSSLSIRSCRCFWKVTVVQKRPAKRTAVLKRPGKRQRS